MLVSRSIGIAMSTQPLIDDFSESLSPVILSFVFIIFPVFAVLIGAWYEGTPISRQLILYSLLLLAGFAITKLPVERLLGWGR